MGACCVCKENKNDNKNEEVYSKDTEDELCLLEIDYDIEKTEFSKMLHRIELKFTNNMDRIYNKVKKISIEQIWNIAKLHNDDYTNSNYLLCDTRDNKFKNENFLKKFKMINYSLDQLQLLGGPSLERFKKYIQNKYIIIISEKINLIMIEELISFLLNLENTVTTLLVDCNLNELNENILFKQIDDINFVDYPFLLLSLRYFPKMNTNKFIYFDYIDSLKGYDSIINKFGIKLIFSIHKDSQEGFIEDNYILKLNLNVTKLEEIVLKNDDILRFYNIIKENINLKPCIFMIEKSIDKDVVIYLIFLMIWYVTDVRPDKSRYYIYEHLIYINDTKQYCSDNYLQIEEFLKINFGMTDNYNPFVVSTSGPIKEYDKFKTYIVNLKNEIEDKKLLNKILYTIDKILKNIIDNPGIDKYYNIKCNSKTFIENIQINKNAVNIIEIIGFKKKIINSGIFYSMNINTNIRELMKYRNDIISTT